VGCDALVAQPNYKFIVEACGTPVPILHTALCDEHEGEVPNVIPKELLVGLQRLPLASCCTKSSTSDNEDKRWPHKWALVMTKTTTEGADVLVGEVETIAQKITLTALSVLASLVVQSPTMP